MTHILDDIYKYKELVMGGLPKLFTGEAFASADEKEAVIHFMGHRGIPIEQPFLIQSLTEAETDEEMKTRLVTAIRNEISNVFKGVYGL